MRFEENSRSFIRLRTSYAVALDGTIRLWTSDRSLTGSYSLVVYVRMEVARIFTKRHGIVMKYIIQTKINDGR